MIAAMSAAAMPMPVNVVFGEQPVDGVLEIGLRAAAGLDQCDAGSRMRNKDVTQPVAAVATELSDHLSDIGDDASSGVQLYDIRIHSPIIAFGCVGRAGRVGYPAALRVSAARTHVLRPGLSPGRGAIEFVDYLTEALDKTSDGSPGIVVLEPRPSRRNDRPN